MDPLGDASQVKITKQHDLLQPEHRFDRRDVGLPANVNTTVWHLLSTLAEARPQIEILKNEWFPLDVHHKDCSFVSKRSQ